MESNNSSNTGNPEVVEQPNIVPASNARGMSDNLLAHAIPAIIDTSTTFVTTNPNPLENNASMRNRIGAWYHSNDSYTGLCSNLEK
jgi:hypothetical protein